MNKRQRKKAANKMWPSMVRAKAWYLGPVKVCTDPFEADLEARCRAMLSDVFDGLVGDAIPRAE